MKKITILILTIAIMCLGYISSNNSVAAAEIVNNLEKDKYYTNTNYLKNEDGSISNESIFNFADYVLDSSPYAVINDLEKVIPKEYLNSQEDITHYYFGEEYGYYFTIENNYMDLMLVDVYYEIKEKNFYTAASFFSPSRISLSTSREKPSTLSVCSFVTPSTLPISTILARYSFSSENFGSTRIPVSFCM